MSWHGKGGGQIVPAGGLAAHTVLLGGFPPNAHDRELENFCRFFPGFVGAKAAVDKGPPKVWVSFETPEQAASAIEQINGLPFDYRKPDRTIFAGAAKTELNPDPRTRTSVWCCAGDLDTLMGTGAMHQADIAATKGGGLTLGKGAVGAKPQVVPAPYSSTPLCRFYQQGTCRNGDSCNFVHADSGNVVAPPAKRARLDAGGGAGGVDTAIVFKPGDMGYDADLLHSSFCQLEGYVGLRMGGANCYVKFEDAYSAQAGVKAMADSGLMADLAKSAMNMEQATHVNQ